MVVSPSSQTGSSLKLLLDSTTDELLLLSPTELFPCSELEDFLSTEELEPGSSLLLDEISPIESGAELLDSSPHAASRARRMDRANNMRSECRGRLLAD